MPNITRGARMTGLMAYLAGPGRHNEHEAAQLVAGDAAIMTWHDQLELSNETALRIGWALDHPRRAFATQVTLPVKDRDGAKVGVKDAHVWHCSLSLRTDEPALSDERWAQISKDFVTRMGFSDQSGDRAPCRWVAVRHGPSSAGNDHVHIVVGLVHEDGTRANVWNDRPNAQRIAGELERQYGLQVLESRDAGHTARGQKPAERENAARRGSRETAPEQLARTVRACAAAAGDEAEFVRRVRRAGVRIRPRYATGSDTVVAGYSVALRPPPGAAVVWYGGGRLARDLTLPRLRADWPDTPEHASAALREWRAAKRNQRPVSAGREARDPDPELWARYTSEVSVLREQLRGVAVEDRALWAHVARETAGAFAAWSVQVEATPGPLAATAASLARSAQLRAHQVRPRQAGLPSARGAALLLASVAHGGSGTVAQAVLLRQLGKVAVALHDAHQAAGDAHRADQVAKALQTQLAVVRDALPPVLPGVAVADAQAAQAVGVARQGQLPARTGGSALPGAAGPAPRPPRSDRPKGNELER